MTRTRKIRGKVCMTSEIRKICNKFGHKSKKCIKVKKVCR